jgi:hypothetical protein
LETTTGSIRLVSQEEQELFKQKLARLRQMREREAARTLPRRGEIIDRVRSQLDPVLREVLKARVHWFKPDGEEHIEMAIAERIGTEEAWRQADERIRSMRRLRLTQRQQTEGSDPDWDERDPAYVQRWQMMVNPAAPDERTAIALSGPVAPRATGALPAAGFSRMRANTARDEQIDQLVETKFSIDEVVEDMETFVSGVHKKSDIAGAVPGSKDAELQYVWASLAKNDSVANAAFEVASRIDAVCQPEIAAAGSDETDGNEVVHIGTPEAAAHSA